MPPPFELTAYLRAIFDRWKRIAVVVAVASVVALLISLLLPKKYEATVLLSVQPAGSDARYPAFMSPTYLEYLHSYEQVLQSDGLLARLVKDVNLDSGPYYYTVETFRATALDLTLVRNTNVLKVRVRFPDPSKAHQIALALAQIGVQINSDANSAEADRASRLAQKEAEDARLRLAACDAAIQNFRRDSRENEIGRQLNQQLERKMAYQERLTDAQVEAAEQEAWLASLSAQLRQEPGSLRPHSREPAGEALSPTPQEEMRQQTQIAAADLERLRARQKALRAELAELEAPLERNRVALASLEARRRQLERDYEIAQSAVVASTNRANDTRFSMAARREELRIADPGVVPSRPSSPRIMLNVLLAAVFGLLAGILYETWAWNSGRQGAA